MSIRALRTLQAIARHGSFASAGAAVGLTQSAVSLQVKSLEEDFGAKLFDRSRRLPVLTDAGKVLVEKSAEVLALYDQLGPALSEEGVLAGKVKLGVIQTALATYLPDALVQLNAAHPDARFHVVAGMSAELAAQVAAHELDAAITTELVRPHPPDLISTPLYEDQFWVVAPKGQEHLSPSELLQAYPFIRFDLASWAGRIIDRALRQMQIRPQEEMILDNQRVILSMVERGLGTAIVPMSPQLAQEIPLTCLPFGTPHMTRRIVMLERPGHSGGQLAAAMAEVMIDLAGSRSCQGPPVASTPNIGHGQKNRGPLMPHVSLFFAAFIAATVLPMQSEVLLAYYLRDPALSIAGLLIAATVGNVLGSTVNWYCGRFLRHFQDRKWFPVKPEQLGRAERVYHKYGRWSLLMSWAPFIGDPLTVIAGILREPLPSFLLIVTIAKAARYLLVAGLALAWL